MGTVCRVSLNFRDLQHRDRMLCPGEEDCPPRTPGRWSSLMRRRRRQPRGEGACEARGSRPKNLVRNARCCGREAVEMRLFEGITEQNADTIRDCALDGVEQLFFGPGLQDGGIDPGCAKHFEQIDSRVLAAPVADR